jgi:hydrogenase maturation protease
VNAPPSILILGIGNLLMGDEGIGVRSVEEMSKNTLPPNVHLLDGGTGGFHLLSLFGEYDYIVLLDATMDGNDAGGVRLTEPRFANDFPRTLSAHDIGLRDLLESAMLIGPLPRLFLVAVSVDGIQPMRTDLSPEVEAAIPDIIRTVHQVLETIAEREARGDDTRVS